MQDFLLRRTLAALLALGLVLLFAYPAPAEARAGAVYGGGRSTPSYSNQGSRGAQSWGLNGAAPRARSPSPFSGGSIWGGLLGGLGGLWLASHLFGRGGGGILGPLIAIVILFFAVRWFLRAGGMGGTARLGTPIQGGRFFGGRAGNPGLSGAGQTGGLALGDADLAAFQRILIEVQAAWNAGDLGRLRAVTTPEMLSYFTNELAQNRSVGLANRVERVELQRGEPRQAWSEFGGDFATCLLRWSALDYTVRLDTGVVADGDPARPVLAEEVWTFRRARGGAWLLSAIQQTA